MLNNNKLSYFFVFILFAIINFKAFAIESLEGAWFECEFSGKTTPPSDNCKMLDNDGFIMDGPFYYNNLTSTNTNIYWIHIQITDLLTDLINART